MTKLLIIIWLVLVGCGATTPHKYDLDAPMPKYDVAEFTDHYDLISALKIKYLYLKGIMLTLQSEKSVQFSDSQVHRLYIAMDKYIYWSSVATIQLFYKDYDKSDESSMKADDGLEELRTKLLEIIEAHST